MLHLDCSISPNGGYYFSRPTKQNIGELWYIAVPYTHKDLTIVESRFEMVTRFTAKLMSEGKFVFSPISHTHPVVEEGLKIGLLLSRGWDYWERYDRAMISRCTKLIVLMLDGWKESVGVTGEIKIAKELGIPIEYREYVEL